VLHPLLQFLLQYLPFLLPPELLPLLVQ
jgi:hypothetical protein